MPTRRAARPAPDSTPAPSTPAPPSEVRATMSAEEAFALALYEMDIEAGREAARHYGSSEMAELEAIAEGAHPKQRALDPRAIDDSRQKAAAAIVAIRKKRGA